MASDYACLDCCDEAPNWQSRLNGISVDILAGADQYTSTRIPDVERRPVHLPAPPDDGPLSRDAGRQSRKSTPDRALGRLARGTPGSCNVSSALPQRSW